MCVTHTRVLYAVFLLFCGMKHETCEKNRLIHIILVLPLLSAEMGTGGMVGVTPIVNFDPTLIVKFVYCLCGGIPIKCENRRKKIKTFKKFI